MPLNTRTIVGQAVYGDNTGASGRLLFTPDVPVAYEGALVLPGPVTVIAGNGGSFQVDLATTDTEGYSPPGWVWKVEEQWAGGRVFFFELPTGDGTPVEYTALIPATSIASPYAAHTHPELDGFSFYGQLSRTTAGTVVVPAVGVYQSTGLVGTLDSLAVGVGLGVTDTLALRNISGGTLRLAFYASADIEAGNNKVLGIKLARDGVPIDETECRAPTGLATSFAKLVTSWIVEVENGQEIALFVADHTTAETLTVQRARIVARSV